MEKQKSCQTVKFLEINDRDGIVVNATGRKINFFLNIVDVVRRCWDATEKLPNRRDDVNVTFPLHRDSFHTTFYKSINAKKKVTIVASVSNARLSHCRA
jgi:hypothetical protein